ncbi:hypothetical protein IEC97_07015 [Neobacillus cucumis]|uniref:hypothetical protein n=1 Tax=Neobacillus cucumis TaxID=1740721 RepID=UPI0018DF35E9|nr:hypothetical protein [Neobacillus cucumis]MBI0577106.1 hypothetical protein [Neobacillus cucumis]
MKRFSVFIFCFVLLITCLPQKGVYAYSYGDPNEEKVAEVYKQMLVKLDENPPNYASAKKLYETVKEEVDMHMGPEPSKLILANLDDQDKKAAIRNMKKLLVLNIARRLESIEKNFSEYDTTKRLLAKAHATYDALSPIVEAEHPENDKKIRKDFDQALESLGNPGLFGVGKKEASIDSFKKNENEILDTLKTEFKIKSLEVGHFSESATEKESAAAKNNWTDISNIRNWIPIILIVAVLIVVIVTVMRRRKQR